MTFSRLFNFNSAVLLIIFLVSSCSANDNRFDNTAALTQVVETGTAVNATVSAEPGAIEVYWSAPAEREDNSPLSLSEIAGYRLYYGTRQGDYLNTIEVDDNVTWAYRITDLTAGTYYIVLTVYDVDGRESLYSDELVVSL